MKKILLLLASCAAASLAHAVIVPIELDNFNLGTATGATIPSTTWATPGNVVQNATTITVGGSAKDDNGWGVENINVNATGETFLTFVAQRGAGNVAPTLTIQFEDQNLNTQVFSLSTSLFSTTSLTAVSIPVTWTNGFDFTTISGWSIGGGNVGINAFNMTFDDLYFSNVAAVPEPSTYALMTVGLGTLVLGLRRKRRA